MTDDTLRIGLIGAGRIAQAAHLPALEQTPELRLTMVADPSASQAEAVAARYGARWTTDTPSLLEADLDAVIVCVPDRLHAALGSMALEAGRHVLMEKPLAPTVQESEALAALAAERGLVLQPGFMKRHDPGIEYAMRHLDRIGPVLSAQLWYRVMAATREGIQDTLFPRMLLDPEVKASEAKHKAADAASYKLMTHGVHQLDLARALLGDVDWVSAHAASAGPDFSWHGTMAPAAGGLASFEITAAVHSSWSEGVDLYGERGHLRIRSPYAFSRLGSSVELHLEAEGETRRPTFTDTNPFRRQLRAFAEAIRSGDAPTPSPEDGVEATRLVLAVAASSRSDGTRVQL